MKQLVASLVFLVLVLPQVAKAEIKGCYERVYDARYLKQHRKQDIVKIRLQIGVGKGNDGPFELLDRVDAGFRKRGIYDGNLIECKPSGEELSCNIEGDGGTFVVTDRGENSLRITNNTFMRFGDDENGTIVQAQGEHREFRLFRVSETACP